MLSSASFSVPEEQLVVGYHLTNMLWTGSYVVLFYDYLLTFDDEMCYIWVGGWGRVRILYLMDRYWPLLNAIPSFLSVNLNNPSTAFCTFCFIWFTFSNLIVQFITTRRSDSRFSVTSLIYSSSHHHSPYIRNLRKPQDTSVRPRDLANLHPFIARWDDLLHVRRIRIYSHVPSDRLLPGALDSAPMDTWSSCGGTRLDSLLLRGQQIRAAAPQKRACRTANSRFDAERLVAIFRRVVRRHRGKLRRVGRRRGVAVRGVTPNTHSDALYHWMSDAAQRQKVAATLAWRTMER